MSFDIVVDVTNPGQFFGACGLFEIAAAIDPDALAWFAAGRFVIECTTRLDAVIAAFAAASLVESRSSDDDDTDDETVDRSAPLLLGAPFSLRLDWWRDRASGGRDLKVWAGTMNNVRIAAAMFAAFKAFDRTRLKDMFDVGQVVPDPSDATKKVEPFYFDARRAPNAHSRDVGFSPDALDLVTTAFPAVELFCLIGLQRFRPNPNLERKRVFTYHTWFDPLPIELAALAAVGAVPMPSGRCYEFENWFRTGQKKHKAFRSAVSVAEGD